MDEAVLVGIGAAQQLEHAPRLGISYHMHTEFAIIYPRNLLLEMVDSVSRIGSCFGAVPVVLWSRSR